jgi:type IX secretion system PorP/SprF family membrane protein
MKSYLYKYYLIALLLSSTAMANGQDIHFSQIFETPLLRNPALAGLFTGDIRIQSVYRSQWNSITDAYRTGSANVEYKLPVGQSNDFVTIGGQLLYDRSGTVELTSTHVLPAINYHKSLGEDKNRYISMALMGGWVQRSINRSKITTNSQYSGTSYNSGLSNGENFGKPSYGFFDGTVGLSYNSQIGEQEDDNMYLGIAYHHFNKPKNISFYTDVNTELKAKWVASAGIRMSTNDYAYITFEGDYSKQTSTQEIIGGLMYTLKLDDPDNPQKLIHGGVYMRLNDAIIPVAKIETKPLAIAVSYDINISSLKRASTGRGGFELSLTYQKFLDRNNSSTDATRCPKF